MTLIVHKQLLFCKFYVGKYLRDDVIASLTNKSCKLCTMHKVLHCKKSLDFIISLLTELNCKNAQLCSQKNNYNLARKIGSKFDLTQLWAGKEEYLLTS